MSIATALVCAAWLSAGCAYLPSSIAARSTERSGEASRSEELARDAGRPEPRASAQPEPPAPQAPSPAPARAAEQSQPPPAVSAPEEPDPKPAAPAPAEPPVPVYIRSDLLEIERSSGQPVAVLLEAGAGEGLRRGMVGELVDGGRVIGELEIIAVYDDGSRARIVGDLAAPITIDTSARLQN